MKAKLFVRGMPEPIELSEEEARVAQAFIGDAAKSSDTPFIIEGIWAGKKADMRYVVFQKPEHEDPFMKIEPMPEAEALAFERDELEKYAAESEREGFGAFNWDRFFLRGKGAVSLNFYAYPRDSQKRGITMKVCDPELYRDLDNKIESFRAWKSKKEYVEKRNLEGLQELADTMSVDDPGPPYNGEGV